MLFMVVERFKQGDPVPVYRRFRERGRMAPPGLEYLGSWVGADLRICYQLMESPDQSLLEQWIESWNDLVDFEVIQVVSSAEAMEMVSPRL
jgi:hypothetical protein